MKALEQGVIASIGLNPDKTLIQISAIYSPGLESLGGFTENWLFWDIKKTETSDKNEFWSARGYRQLETGLRLPVPLDLFDGCNGIDSEKLDELIVGLGLNDSLEKHEKRGNSKNYSNHKSAGKTKNTIDSVRSQKWFFSQGDSAMAKAKVMHD